MENFGKPVSLFKKKTATNYVAAAAASTATLGRARAAQAYFGLFASKKHQNHWKLPKRKQIASKNFALGTMNEDKRVSIADRDPESLQLVKSRFHAGFPQHRRQASVTSETQAGPRWKSLCFECHKEQCFSWDVLASY